MQNNGEKEVQDYLSTVEPSKLQLLEYLRQLMAKIDPRISEQIKWNSLSFYYTGEMGAFDPKTYARDIMVCNIHRGKLLLVFPTGAKVEDLIGGKNYPDGRKIININDFADLETKHFAITELVRKWLAMVV